MRENEDITLSSVDLVSEDELERAIADRVEEMKSETPKDVPKTAKENSKGHRARVKERFLRSGLESFAPHEVLELLLFYAIPMKDTKQIAHELINRFGSVAGVFNAEISELTKVNSITENTAVLFRLIPQLMAVYYTDESRGVSYTNTDMLAKLFRPHFVGAGAEKFLLGCFDSELRVISITEISRGTSAYTSIEMRKIMSEVLKSGCTMAALAHNHPGSSPKPSDEDVCVTRKINELLREVDVQLMDHIIVGGSKTYSMLDGGDLGIFD